MNAESRSFFMSLWDINYSDEKSHLADSDFPSEKTIERRRQADLEFIQKIKTVSVETLETILKVENVAWKRVAIIRRIKGINPST